MESSPVSRAVHRAKVLAGLDALSASSSSSDPPASRLKTGTIQLLQEVCGDDSEKGFQLLSSLIVGKSIVLDNVKDVHTNSHAVSRIKRQLDQDRKFSNKKRKLAKKGVKQELQITQEYVNSLHKMWESYARRVFKSYKKSSHLQQLELIGAYVVVVDTSTSSSKLKGLHGIIVDQSKNSYTIAERRQEYKSNDVGADKCNDPHRQTSGLDTSGQSITQEGHDSGRPSRAVKPRNQLAKITTLLKNEVVLAVYLELLLDNVDTKGHAKPKKTKKDSSKDVGSKVTSTSSASKVLLLHGGNAMRAIP